MAKILLPLALATSWLLVPGFATARAQGATLHAGDPNGPVMLAKDKKKGKKKKKKKDEDEEGFGPSDIEGVSGSESDSGAGVHREQEGVDTPYKVEANGTTTLSFLSTEVEGADPADSTIISVGGEFLFILGAMEIGAGLFYDSETSKETTTVTDPTTKKTTSTTSETKSSRYDIGPVFKFNFGSLDHDSLVPFAHAGLGITSSESKSGDADAVKASGTRIRVGGGLNMFLDSNVSFQPKLEYMILTEKGDGDDAKEVKTSGFRIILGLGIFI